MDWPMFENEFKSSTTEYILTGRENLRRLNTARNGKARRTSHRLEILRSLVTANDSNIESFRSFFNIVLGTGVALNNV